MEGVKRKLPSWMSKASITSTIVGQSEAEKVSVDNILKDETASQSLLPKTKGKEKLVKKSLCTADGTLDNEPKKRKRKTFNRGEWESNDIEVPAIMVERKKKESCGRKIRKKRKESTREASEDIESPLSNEDDGELTVEDLMTIAREYVRRDEESGKQYLPDVCQERKSKPAFAFSFHESEDLPYVPPKRDTEPPMPEETNFVHNSIIRSEDPAQDMLDLFLGPLLNKPVSEDRVIKQIEEHKTFVREVKEQVNDNGSALADSVPLTKKKSSLKGKMFFG